jgi:hypothetical protein
VDTRNSPSDHHPARAVLALRRHYHCALRSLPL